MHNPETYKEIVVELQCIIDDLRREMNERYKKQLATEADLRCQISRLEFKLSEAESYRDYYKKLAHDRFMEMIA